MAAYLDGPVRRFNFSALDVHHAGHDCRVIVQNFHLKIVHLNQIGSEGARFDELRIVLFVGYAAVPREQVNIIGIHAPDGLSVALLNYSGPVVLDPQQFLFNHRQVRSGLRRRHVGVG